jgi:hypothetical protein
MVIKIKRVGLLVLKLLEEKNRLPSKVQGEKLDFSRSTTWATFLPMSN